MKKKIVRKVAPSTKKYSHVSIDCIDYKLAFSFNSISIAEQHAGVNLMNGLVNMSMGVMTARQLHGLFYAALLPAQSDMTLEDAGELIRIETMQSIITALQEAYTLSMPPVEDGKADGKLKNEPAQ